VAVAPRCFRRRRRLAVAAASAAARRRREPGGDAAHGGSAAVPQRQPGRVGLRLLRLLRGPSSGRTGI